MKTLRITIAFLLTTANSIAQPYNIDSLKKRLIEPLHDTTEVKVLREIARAYENYKPDSALYYAKLLIGLAQKLDDKDNMASGFFQSAVCFDYLGNYPAGLQMCLNGKKIAEELYKEGKPENLIFSYLGLGILEKSSGRYANAIANFNASIKLATTRGSSKDGYYAIYSQLGAAYLGFGKLDSALLFVKKAYDLSLLTSNKKRLPAVYTFLGNVYEKTGNYQEAKKIII